MEAIGSIARRLLAGWAEAIERNEDREGANPLPASDARGGEVARFGKGTAAEASRYHRSGGGKRGRRPTVGRSEL